VVESHIPSRNVLTPSIHQGIVCMCCASVHTLHFAPSFPPVFMRLRIAMTCVSPASNAGASEVAWHGAGVSERALAYVMNCWAAISHQGCRKCDQSTTDKRASQRPQSEGCRTEIKSFQNTKKALPPLTNQWMGVRFREDFGTGQWRRFTKTEGYCLELTTRIVSLAGDINHDFFADQNKVSGWACRRGEPGPTSFPTASPDT
jgi:hypothetical protein